MLTTPGTISAVHRLITETIQRECITENAPLPHMEAFPEPVEQEFLVLRGAAMKMWIVLHKPNDPDRKVIVFDPQRQCFGIATSSIATIPGKGFFIRYCDSFQHALEKAGIVLPSAV